MAGTSTLLALRAQSEARLVEEKKLADRRRHLGVLIHQYLVETGYTSTAASLVGEAGTALSKLQTADNMDLGTIVQEFESYYELKFGKKPRLVRQRGGDEGGGDVLDHGSSCSTSGSGGRRGSDPSRTKGAVRKAGGSKEGPAAAAAAAAVPCKDVAPTVTAADLEVKGTSTTSTVVPPAPGGVMDDDAFDEVLPRHLRPLPPCISQDPELRLLAGAITRDILQRSPRVRWEDIVGLDGAKRLLREAVVMPVQYPQIFTGPLLSPWSGILLYGPPGTGKTMLAKAVASQCRTTFFNISASSIVSKYRGDSEKLVRVLFDLARHHAPSTIFIDEIDSLMGQRGASSNTEHEGSLRMKTELLIQMDGLANGDALVFVLAASNLPWNLDSALLRRLEKRVMVPLPCEGARRILLEKLLPPDRLSEDVDLSLIASKTADYSGADLRLLCKEAAMRPVRRLMAKLDSLHLHSANPSSSGQQPGHHMRRAVSDTDVQRELLADPISAEDLSGALTNTRRSAHFKAEKYKAWEHEFGAT